LKVGLLPATAATAAEVVATAATAAAVATTTAATATTAAAVAATTAATATAATTVAAATTAAARAAEAATAAARATAATATTFATVFGLTDHQGTTADILAVELANRGLTGCRAVKFDKSESTAATRLALGNHLRGNDLAVLSEQSTQLFRCHRKSEVSYIELLRH
jgi:hypothetical protein